MIRDRSPSAIVLTEGVEYTGDMMVSHKVVCVEVLGAYFRE